MSGLKGKTALVTGGGTGIGRAVALALAGDGAQVTITGRRQEALAEVAGLSANIEFAVMDVTDENSVVATIRDHGPVDILVANAGIAETMPLRKITLDHWRKVQSVNVEGVMLCMRETMPAMAERGWGRIIVVSSIAGLRGVKYGSAYCASKHAVLGLVKCAAEEVLKKGVTVNAICPGYVATQIVDNGVENIMRQTGLSKEEALAALRDSNPFGRLIEPEEVAECARWLCSQASGAVTAQAIPISGGQV